jgi:cellulose synthase (UDP-forming)
MTDSPLWREFESGDGVLLKILRFFVIAAGVVFLGFTGVLELTWPQQLVLGLLTVLVAIWMDRSSSSYLVTLTLMIASMYATFRYGFWRIATTGKFFLDPGSSWSLLDAFFISLLLLAEAYAFIILFLWYMQTVWPHAGSSAGRPADVALNRPADSDVQRAAERCEVHGTRFDEHRLAGGQTQRLHS